MHFQVNFETSNYPEIEHPPKYIYFGWRSPFYQGKMSNKKIFFFDWLGMAKLNFGQIWVPCIWGLVYYHYIQCISLSYFSIASYVPHV